MLAGHEHTLEIHIHDCVPRGHLEIDGLAVTSRAADIVVQDVDAAVAIHAGLGNGLAVFLSRDVGQQHRYFSAILLHSLISVLNPGLVDVHQQQGGSLLRKTLCRSTPVAHRIARLLPRANNDGHFGLQPALVHSHFLPVVEIF